MLSAPSAFVGAVDSVFACEPDASARERLTRFRKDSCSLFLLLLCLWLSTSIPLLSPSDLCYTVSSLHLAAQMYDLDLLEAILESPSVDVNLPDVRDAHDLCLLFPQSLFEEGLLVQA